MGEHTPALFKGGRTRRGKKSPHRNPQDCLQPLEKGKASDPLNRAGLWGGKMFMKSSSSFPTPVNGAVALTFLWKSTQGFKDGKCCFSTVIFIQREYFRGRRGFSTYFHLFFYGCSSKSTKGIWLSSFLGSVRQHMSHLCLCVSPGSALVWERRMGTD